MNNNNTFELQHVSKSVHTPPSPLTNLTNILLSGR